MRRAGAAISLLGVGLVLSSALGPGSPRAGAATSATTLAGEGDSWALPTINQLYTDAGTAGVFGSLAPNYVPETATGEDGARNDFVSGRSDFAVSGAPLTSDEASTATQNGITPAYVPFAAGPVDIVVAVTARGPSGLQLITGLKFSLPTLEKIMTHSGITRWDDGQIVAENPQAATLLGNVVNPTITVVERADTSATTTALAAGFLANPATQPLWEGFARSEGIATPSVPPDHWPRVNDVNSVGEIGGSDQVAQDMLNYDPRTHMPTSGPDNSIGYLGPGWAAKYNIPVATITNLAGNLVLPTNDAVDKAIASGTTFDATNNLYSITENFDYSKITDPAAYPIPLVSYLIVPTAGALPGKAAALSNLVKFVLGTQGQQDVATTGLRPVSSAAVTAGLRVADAVAASQATTTTTSSTSSTSTSSTSSTSTSSTSTSTTALTTGTTTPAGAAAAASGDTTEAAAAPSGATSPVASPSSDSASAQLPVTGGRINWALAIAGLILLAFGDVVRRRARRAAR